MSDLLWRRSSINDYGDPHCLLARSRARFTLGWLSSSSQREEDGSAVTGPQASDTMCNVWLMKLACTSASKRVEAWRMACRVHRSVCSVNGSVWYDEGGVG